MARITYGQGRGSIRVTCDEIPEPTTCIACNRRKGDQLKQVQQHHWLYKFRKETVKKNPKLAWENSIVVCFPHHRVADALREIYQRNAWEYIIPLIQTMPPRMRANFISRLRDICSWLEEI